VKLTKKILSLFLACLMVFSTMSVAQAAVVDTVSTQVSSKAETVDVSKSNGLLSLVDGFKTNEMFERVSSTLKNIEIKNPFTAIKSLDFDTTKISANLAKQLDEGESGFERLIAAIKVGFNNAKLYVNNFIALSSEIITQTEEAGSSEVEYGVSSTYTATIPGYILATAPSDDLNVYTVSAENVVIPLKTELAVTILKDGQMVHKDDENTTLEYNMYKVAQKEGEADKKVENVRDRLFKVPAGFTEGTSADIYATVSDGDIQYAGVYEEETVVFNLKVTDISFTDEELENNEFIFKIGKTKPEYVLAEFNDDYTSVEIFASGTFSDGLMMDWAEADESNPFYAHRDTLKEIIFTGSLTHLTSIGANAFNGCEKIEGEVKIPSSVTLVGTNAFANCYGITEVVFTSVDISQASTFSLQRTIPLTPEKPEVYENASVIVGDGAFENCTGIVSVDLGNNVIELKSKAFAGCTGLTEFNSGASCETIGCAAFRDCVNIETFVLPNVQTIDYGVFENTMEEATVILQAPTFKFVGSMPNKANLIIGKTVETISCDRNTGCFKYYDENATKTENGVNNTYEHKVILGSVTFESDSALTLIGKSSFEGQTTAVFSGFSLENITTVGENAFYNCGNLSLDELQITSETTDIEKMAFSGDDSELAPKIKAVVFEDDCATNVLEAAFKYSSVETVDFGESSPSISKEAFNSTKISHLVVPNTVTYVGDKAFNALKELRFEVVKSDGHIPSFYNYDSCFELVEDFTVYFGYLISNGVVLTPSDVASTGSTAIYDFENVTQSGFKYNGSDNCKYRYLQAVNDDDGYEWAYGWRDYYYNSPSQIAYLNNIVFTDNVKYVEGEWASRGLKSIDFGKNVESIGAYAFSGNQYTDECEIILPKALKQIGEYAFASSNWKSLTVNDNLEIVGEAAFFNCVDMTGDLSFTDACVSIENFAFYNCVFLDSLTLGESVKNIGVAAFYSCKNMTGDIFVSGDNDAHSDKDNNGRCDACNCWMDCDLLVDTYNEVEFKEEGNKPLVFKPKQSGVYSITLTLDEGSTILPSEAMTIVFDESYSPYTPEDFECATSIPQGKKTVVYTGTFSCDRAYTFAPYVSESFSGSVSVEIKYEVDGCLHLNRKTVEPFVPAVNCIVPGNTGIVECLDCGKTVSNKETLFGNCVDVDENDVCDICAGVFSEINIGETKEVTPTNGTLHKYRFIPKYSGEYYIKGDVTSYLYSSKGYQIKPSEYPYGQNSDKYTLEAGKTYYWGIKSNQTTDITLVYLDCPHPFYVEETAPTTADSCKTYGYSGSAYCYVCGETVYTNQKTRLGDCVDENSDGVCDVCENTLSNVELYKKYSFVFSADYEPQTFTFRPTFSSGYQVSYISGDYNLMITTEDGTEIKASNEYRQVYYLEGGVLYNFTFTKIERAEDDTFSGGIVTIGIINETNTIEKHKALGKSAFRYCSSLSSVAFGEGIKEIPNYFLNGCTNLQETTFPNSLIKLGLAAFADCPSLETPVVLSNPNFISIGMDSFARCTSIPEIKIVSPTVSLESDAFYKCTGVTKLTVAFPELTAEMSSDLGVSSYKNSWDLVLLDSVKTIGEEAFTNNDVLKTVSLGKSVSSLGAYSFNDCDSLETVINNSTQNIVYGDYSFNSCGALNTFNLGRATIIGNRAFYGTNFTTVDFPDGLLSLGDYAFANCLALAEISEFPETLTQIGNYCFYNSSNLGGDIVVPSNTKLIGEYAFSPCAITSVSLQGDTTIGKRAFYNCKNIKTIDLGDGKTSLSEGCFTGCSEVQEINIGNGVDIIPDNAFSACTKLTTVDFGDTITSIGNGAFKGTNLTGELDFPDTLETIGDSSFEGLKNINGTITIPSNLTQIGNSAFKNCAGVTGLVLNEKISQIGNSAFEGCSGITGEIVFPSTCVTIGNSAFKSCSNLSSVVFKTGVETIGNSAFEECVLLGSVDFGESVVTIGDRAFFHCIKIPELIFPNSLLSIGSYAFGTKTSGSTSSSSYLGYIRVDESNQMRISNIVMSENIKHIGTGAFLGCANLTSVSVPDTLETVGNSVYAYCYGLKTYNLPNLMFEESSSCFLKIPLSNVVIPSGVTKLASSIFKGNDAVTSVTIPESVKVIGNHAFGGCSNLKAIVFNEGLETIEYSAFMNCTNLFTLKFPDSLVTIENNAFGGKAYYSDLWGGYLNHEPMYITDITFGSGLKTIGAEAFFPSRTLTCEVVFPATLEYVGDRAFYNIDPNDAIYRSPVYSMDNEDNGKDEDGNALPRGNGKADGSAYDVKGRYVGNYSGYKVGSSSITLNGKKYYQVLKSDGTPVYAPSRLADIQFTGSSLQYIGEQAFGNQYAFSSGLVLSGENLVIGDKAFEDCTNVSSITIDGATSIGNSAFENCKKAVSINLPKNLSSISDFTFYNCNSLTSLILPENLETIGDSAFYGCSALDGKLVVPDSVTSIAQKAFYNCVSLDELYLSKTLKDIGNEAFYGFSGVLLDVPGDLEEMGENVFGEDMVDEDGALYIGKYLVSFDNIKNLTSYTVKEGTIVILENAFEKESLEEVVMPNTVTTIQESAFREMPNLKNVVFSESLEKIGDYAFYKCPLLETPVNLTEKIVVGEYAFAECAVITGITMDAGSQKIGDYAFQNCSSAVAECITIGDGSTIGKYAFNNCDGIKKVSTIAEDPVINERAFRNCDGLTTVEVLSSLQKLESSEKVLDVSKETSIENSTEEQFIKVEADYDGLATVRRRGDTYKLRDWSYKVYEEDKVTPVDKTYTTTTVKNNNGWDTTIIDGVSFNVTGGKTYYVSITLPEVLLDSWIVESYFEHNINIEYTFDEPCAQIHNTAFDNSTNITHLVFGCDYVSFGLVDKLTFYADITKNYTVEFVEGVKVIGSSAFCGDSSDKTPELTGNITFPDSLVMIKDQSSFANTNIEGVLNLNSVMYVGKDAFYQCNLLTSVVGNNSLLTTGERSFYKCTALESINISTKSLGNYCFEYCEKLSSIQINSLEVLGQYAFAYNPLIVNVTLPDNLKEIGNGAFAYCEGLETINIPKSTEFVDESFLYNSENIKEIRVQITNPCTFDGTFISNKNNVTRLDYTVYIENLAPWCNSSFLTSDANPMVYAKEIYIEGVKVEEGYVLNIPEEVTKLRKYTFYWLDGVTEINIPDTVTSRQNSVFQKVSDVETVSVPFLGTDAESEGSLYNMFGSRPANLQNLTVRGGVIGEFAFQYLGNMNSVVIGKDAKITSAYCYQNYDGRYNSDTTIKTIQTLKIYCKDASIRYINVVNLVAPFEKADVSSYCTSSGYTGVKSITVIGTKIPNYFIGNSNLSCNYTGLTNLTFSQPIESVGEYAFAGLQTANLNVEGAENLSNVKEIGSCAFNNCTALGFTLGLSSLTSVSDYAFKNSKNISFDGSVENCDSFGREAFYNVTEFDVDVLIKENARINNSAFYGTSIKKVVVGKGVQLNENCFGNIKTLEYVELKDGCYPFFDTCKHTETYVSAERVEAVDCKTPGHTEQVRCKLCDYLIDAQEVLYARCSFGEDNVCDICGEEKPNNGDFLTLENNVITSVLLSNEYARIPFAVNESGWYKLTIKPLIDEKAQYKLTSDSYSDYTYSGVYEREYYIEPYSDNCWWIYVAPERKNQFEVSIEYIGETKSTDSAWYNQNNYDSYYGNTHLGPFSGSNVTTLKLEAGCFVFDYNVYGFNGSTLKNLVLTGNSQMKKALGWSSYDGCEDATNSQIVSSVSAWGYPNSFYTNNIDWLFVLENIAVEDDSYYSSQNGVLYNKEKTEILWVPAKLAGNITIPSGIENIPSGIFKNRNISGVVFPETLKSIRSEAFSGCSLLSNAIIIPDETTIIEDYAFSGCPLSGLTLGSKLESIGSYAFMNCSSISNDVSFPSGLRFVGISAFDGCSNLKGDLVVPENCEVSAYSFRNCSSLSSIDFRSSQVTIPYSVFENCSSATGSIVFGENATTVQENAFKNCSSLKTIDLSNVTYVYSSAFENCSSVTSIDLGNVQSIGDNAFFNASSLTEPLVIPDTCYYVGNYAFADTNVTAPVTKLHIGKALNNFGKAAFLGLANIAEITCNDQNSAFKAENNVLYNKKGDTIVLGSTSVEEDFIPTSVIKTVAPYAFAYNPKIKTLVVPKTLTLVDEGAFAFMPNFTTLDFEEGIEKINDYGFAYNTALTGQIQLPDSLLYIGAGAFAGCTNIEWIGISKNTRFVGTGAFDEVTNVTLDTDNPYITIVDGEFVSTGYTGDGNEGGSGDGNEGGSGDGTTIFIGKDSPASVQCEVLEDGKTIRIFGDGEMMDFGSLDPMGDEWVDSPFEGAFSEAGIETIIIEDGVTSVGSFAFAYTEGFEELMNGESSSTLKKVVLGKDVEKIGDAAFMANINARFEISEENPYLVYENGLLKSKDNKTVYTATTEFEGSFIGGEELESLSMGAFVGSKVTSVTLPEGVKHIPMYAFAFCPELTSVSFPGAVSFGMMVVAYCSKLNTVELPVNIPLITGEEELEVAQYAFLETMSEGLTLKVVGSGEAPYYSFVDYIKAANGSGDEISIPFYCLLSMALPIKEVDIGDDITYISDMMFAFMDEEDYPDMLETIKIGDSVEAIGSAAFIGRTGIKNIVISENNENLVLEDGVIYDLEKTKPMLLTSSAPKTLTFPESVTEIPAAFGMMSEVTSITLGENVSVVGDMAFYYTPYLEKVEVHNNFTEFGEMSMYGNGYYTLYAEEDSTAVAHATLLNDEYDCEIVITGTLCKHENSAEHDKVEATCTTVGYTAGVYCPDCESWLKGHEKIVKTHEDKNNDGICEICDKAANDIELGVEKSFVCDSWDYYNEDQNPIETYKWIRYFAPFTGTYTLNVADNKHGSRVDLIVLKTEDVYSLDINDEAAVEEAYVCANVGYDIEATMDLEESETYWIGVRFYYGDSGSITVKLDSDDCPHEKQTVIREATTVVDCSDENCGKSELIQCESCRKVITDDIRTYKKHTNENFDNECDVCGDTLSDISIGETFDYKTTNKELEWVKFTAPVTSVYELKVGYGYDAYTKVYARDKITLVYDDTSTDSVANVSLEAGETYYIQLAPRYSSSSGSFVINMPLCTHLHKLEEGTAIEPVRCDQPGVWNKVICRDCGKVVHDGEPKELSHIDNNVDGVCDVCDLHTADYIVKGASDRWYKVHATTDGVYLFHDADKYDGELRENNNAELELWNLDKDVLISKETGYDRIEVELSANTNYYLRVVGSIYYSGPQWYIKDCYHTHTRVDKKAVAPEHCGQIGTTGIIWCRDCKTFVCNDDVLELPHTDKNKDYVCDVCSHNTTKLPINESYDVNLQKSRYTWFEFIPTVDGRYNFYSQYSVGRNYTNVELYCDGKLIDSGKGMYNRVFELEEGKVYFIGLLTPSYTSSSDVMIVNLLDCQHIHQRVDKLPTKATDCKNPGRAGIVYCTDCCTFLTNDEVTEIIGHVDANGDGKCDSCKEVLSDIVPGQTKTIDVVAGSVTYLKFIPTETASYTFTSVVGSGDTYGFLYDENKKQITYNDDGGGSSQFKITYTLEAGKTYYWGARFYSTSKSGSFNVTLVQN